MKETMPYMMKVMESDAFQELKAITIALEHRCVIDRDIDHLDTLDTLLNAIYYQAAKCENDNDVEKCIEDITRLLDSTKAQMQDAMEEELEAASNEVNKVYH